MDSASLKNTADGGCKLTVKKGSGHETINPFAEFDGPYVTVGCTWEGQVYTSTWEDNSIFNVIVSDPMPTPKPTSTKKPTPTPTPKPTPTSKPTPTPKPTPTLTPQQEKDIAAIEKTTPNTLPPGIIKGGRIKFKAYKPTTGVKITGYEYAVKEGENGSWKTVKNTSDEATMSSQFGSLKQGETYWYSYRYYLTVNGQVYYSNWSDVMGDVYTIYD